MSTLYAERMHRKETRKMTTSLARAAGALLLLALGVVGASGSANAASLTQACPESVSRCTYAPEQLALRQLHPVPATRALPATAAPSVAVESRLLGYSITLRGLTHFVVTGLRLHITGSHFTPGHRVAIAVVDTSHWTMLFRGYTFAQDAVVSVMCPWGYYGCYKENPQAGTIERNVRLSGSPPASLEVLYQSAGQSGMSQVIVK